MSSKKYLILLSLIIAAAFFLRFYQLGNVPHGLYSDETAIGYNAYSLIKTGKDEFGKTFPLYFKSFGDWKLPVYIYSDIISIQLFGLNAFAVRFPSAFFGFLSVVIFYFFIKDLTKNKTLALTATALLAINPWSLQYNRATFEVSIGLFLFILGGYLLNIFFQRKISGTFFGAVVCFLFAFYSYNLTRLLAPVLFGLFLFYNRKLLRKADKTEIIISSVIAFISLIPFFLTLKVGGGAGSASGTLIFSSAQVLAPLHELRAYANTLPGPLSQLFFNKYFLLIWQYIQNIFSYLSVPFFFITGSPHGNHGIGNVGLFYLFELPLVIWGVVSLIKKRIPGVTLLIGWAVAVILVAALTRDVPHATRSFFLVLPLEVMSAAGFLAIIRWTMKRKSILFRSTVFIISGLFILYNLMFYFTSYYIRFPVFYAKSWRLQDQKLSLYLKDNDKKYNKIIFDDNAGFMYSSLLFYTQYSPEHFQKTAVRTPDDSEGFTKVLSFGKYEFRDINWEKDIQVPNALIITTQDKLPKGYPTLNTILFPKRTVAYSVKQVLYQYPVEDVAYVVVETK